MVFDTVVIFLLLLSIYLLLSLLSIKTILYSKIILLPLMRLLFVLLFLLKLFNINLTVLVDLRTIFIHGCLISEETKHCALVVEELIQVGS